MNAKRFIVFSFIVFQLNAFALPPPESSPNTFIAPNETTPADLIPHVQAQSSGLYVSVGSDRGFTGIALTPKADALLLVDKDAAVVTFNQINAALLSVSNSREDYVQWRVNPQRTLAEWKILGTIQKLPTDLKMVFEDSTFFDWWQKSVVKSEAFASFHQPPKPGRFFYGANYLHDDSLFSRLQRLAREGKIWVLQADVSKNEGINILSKMISNLNIKVTVFDWSNAWMPQFIGLNGIFENMKTNISAITFETRVVFSFQQEVKGFGYFSLPARSLLRGEARFRQMGMLSLFRLMRFYDATQRNTCLGRSKESL